MKRPKWTFNYLTHKKFEMANVKAFTKKGTSIATKVLWNILTNNMILQ